MIVLTSQILSGCVFRGLLISEQSRPRWGVGREFLFKAMSLKKKCLRERLYSILFKKKKISLIKDIH